jgi:hypothetical protein
VTGNSGVDDVSDGKPLTSLRIDMWLSGLEGGEPE